MSNNVSERNRKAWVADQGDGTFINPILHADYSDPDVIRVGDDFYMTASSFGHIPGLPILHSKDLVNWKLINHAIKRMDLPGYDQTQHGNGVWAPAIRFHDNKFWIFYGDPDIGIFMCTATDPAGEWSPLHLVHEGKGLIDPCPFWDEDGSAYLVHAYARSRAGIKHLLRLCPMSPDGTKLLGEGELIFDGTEHHPTIEGPKMYKRNGYYYIMAPAGGVSTGWQTALRAKNVFGPYEDKIVLHQGSTPVNGPHQGGWVELASGESWFLHFQDKEAYGRIVHLQPVQWVNDWPLMGENHNENEAGEPVLHYKKPDVGKQYPIEVPADSDEFSGPALGLQWQWQANPNSDWYSLTDRASHLRLFAQPLPASTDTLYRAPHLVMQKFPALTFNASAKLDCTFLKPGEKAGLVVFGHSFAYLAIEAKQDSDRLLLVYVEGNADKEQVKWQAELKSNTIQLSVHVNEEAKSTFSYKLDNDESIIVDALPFQAVKGHWVGAKVGLFALAQSSKESNGYVDVDWFRIN